MPPGPALPDAARALAEGQTPPPGDTDTRATHRAAGRRIRWALRLIALLTLALLAYGPLFVWLPITPGFVREREDLVDVLHRPAHPLTPAQRRFGMAARVVEVSIGMRFRTAVPVVLCDDWSDMRRFMPWLPVNRGLGARTLPLGHVVYVTPLVRDWPDADIFVRHELVHVLLHQHMPVLQRLDGGKPAWLIEGVATFYGNPASYPAGDRLPVPAGEADVTRLLRDGPEPGGGTRFYAVSRDFVGYLVGRFGADRLRAFLADYAGNPADWSAAFSRAFGVGFEDALHAFGSAEGSEK